MERVRETFAVKSVALLRRETEAPASAGSLPREHESGGLRGTWSRLASVGDDPCARPDEGDTEVPVGEDLVLVLRGRRLAAEDQRMLAAFATEVAVAYQQRQLTEAARAAGELAETDRARTALLNAVSHDLRTPIAAAKAAVSSLRSDDIDWSDQDQQELLANADSALDRLTALVTNLLDLSRLQAGALSVNTRPIGLDDVVSRALHMTTAGDLVELDVPPELPAVQADAGLLERVIANVIENALRYNPPGERIRVAASAHADTVELRVVDRGPGIAPDVRRAVFEPFQRRDDRAVRTGAGVGLGLAIARGFVEAMRGAIALEDTPGGGLTVSVALPSVVGTRSYATD
jgi:two-component system sensor histidine kinase KdpD